MITDISNLSSDGICFLLERNINRPDNFVKEFRSSEAKNSKRKKDPSF
jgi:hypothetical protein